MFHIQQANQSNLDLSYPPSSLWRGHRYRRPVALQPHHHRDHAHSRQPHRMADRPHVWHLLTDHGVDRAGLRQITRGRRLEDMDIIFGTVDEAQRRADVEQALEKSHACRGYSGALTDLPAWKNQIT